MPRVLRPHLTPTEEAAIDVFGASPLRIAILAHLARFGSSTRSEIEAGVGVTSDAIKTHLRELEAAGVIVGVPAPAERSLGQRVRWTRQLESLEEQYAALGRAIGVLNAETSIRRDP